LAFSLLIEITAVLLLISLVVFFIFFVFRNHKTADKNIQREGEWRISTLDKAL